MSKVLFVNNYREGTGYSNAGLDFILALDAAGVDVVPRHLNLTGSNFPIPERVKELEAKNAKGADIVIQYTLPHFMSFNGNYRNIALFDYETDGAVDNNWALQLNLMDDVWVTNDDQMAACSKMGVIPDKISRVSHTTDITKYQQSYDKFPFPETEDKFVFYYIGEMSKRKNLEGLIKAFHLEFDRTEPVELILKLNIPGLAGQDAANEANKYCSMVKKGMKIYHEPERYKQEILITDRLSDEDIMRLHATGDCFITTAHGEGWCKPAFDAMAMGKTPIVTNTGGLKEFVTNKTGWLCDGMKDPVFGCDNGFPNLYTANESWIRTDINAVRRAMREAFENKELKESKAEAGIEKALEFRYDRIGKKLKGLLNV